MDLVSTLLGGLAAGMVLFIVSVGLSVTMGLMGFVNLAHGGFAMLGGYYRALTMRHWGLAFCPRSRSPSPRSRARRWSWSACSTRAVPRLRARPGAVHHRPGVRDDRRGHARRRPGVAARGAARVAARPDRPRLHPVPHLQPGADRRRHRADARAVARLRAHAHRRAHPRRGGQPPHGGVAGRGRRAPVHPHVRARQRPRGGGRRASARRSSASIRSIRCATSPTSSSWWRSAASDA